MNAFLNRLKQFKNKSKKTLIAGLLFSCLAAHQQPASATEFGGSVYPHGAEDFMMGALPPPGFYFLNYFNYYESHRFNDSKGNEAILGFDLQVVANGFRFLYITPYKFLGGFWGMQVFLPFARVDIDLPNVQQSKFGLADLVVDPFMLSWHTKNLHVATGIDIYIPTGRYDAKDLANIGRNYWTIEPVVALTLLTDRGWEASFKFMYDFNTKNQATDYLSGQELHFDYTFGKKFKNVSLGVGGYYDRQTTNDEQGGVKVGPDGNKGQVFALGPQIKIDHKKMGFTLKYTVETYVRNRPKGDKLWLKFLYAF